MTRILLLPQERLSTLSDKSEQLAAPIPPQAQLTLRTHTFLQLTLSPVHHLLADLDLDSEYNLKSGIHSPSFTLAVTDRNNP